MAAPQQPYIDNLKGRVRTLYDNSFLFDTIDENGDILGYVDRETGEDIVNTDDLRNHENFELLSLENNEFADIFYDEYDLFMVYVIKDILLPFMLPTYQQTRNADINGQIEAFLGAGDTDLRIQEINVPTVSDVNDIDIFIAEIHRKDTSMNWDETDWRKKIYTLIYRVHNFLKEAIRVNFRLEYDILGDEPQFLDEAERLLAPQLLEKLEQYLREYLYEVNRRLIRPQSSDAHSALHIFDPIAKTQKLIDLYNIDVTEGHIDREGKARRSSRLVAVLTNFLREEHENFKAVDRYIEQRLRDFAEFVDDAELQTLRTIDNTMDRVVKNEQRPALDEWVRESEEPPSVTQPARIVHLGGKKKRKSNKKISKRRKCKAKSKKRKQCAGSNPKRFSKKTNRKTKRKSNKRISKRKKQK